MSRRDRDAWLAARCGGITGTDISAILGLNPWRSAMDVWLEKTGQGMPVADNEAMWWGRYLEEGMARRYMELTGMRRGDLLRGAAIASAFPVSRVQVFGSRPQAQVLVAHKEHPFILATMDGLAPSRQRGLELKTVGDYASAYEWGEAGTDQVPLHYLTQVAQYMAVADLPEWDVGALIGTGARISGTLALYTVRRNRALEAELTSIVVRQLGLRILPADLVEECMDAAAAAGGDVIPEPPEVVHQTPGDALSARTEELTGMLKRRKAATRAKKG